ncbi:hypothetical protein GCM10027589_34650 [Actinocorallia lasiicapitis]
MSRTPQAAWRKSSHSATDASSNCVEVAQQRDRVAARDSKRPDGDVLRFGAGAWGTFVREVRTGGLG